jgi:hypothetical protein
MDGRRLDPAQIVNRQSTTAEQGYDASKATLPTLSNFKDAARSQSEARQSRNQRDKERLVGAVERNVEEYRSISDTKRPSRLPTEQGVSRS